MKTRKRFYPLLLGIALLTVATLACNFSGAATEILPAATSEKDIAAGNDRPTRPPRPEATITPAPAPDIDGSDPKEIRVTIQLDANNSGSNGSDGVGQAQAGDNANDQRVSAYLSWDLSAIPASAEIVWAQIHWGTQCFRGGDVGPCNLTRSPFLVKGMDRLGHLQIKHYPYGDLSTPSSIMLNPSTIIPFQTYSFQPTDTLDVTDQVVSDRESNKDFQLLVSFENATYESGIGNGLIFVEGNGPNKLEVLYTMP
jgi:hypothetical protein